MNPQSLAKFIKWENSKNRIVVTILISLFAVLLMIGCEGENSPKETLDPSAAQGKKLFTTHCAACHATSGNTVIVGPSLAGIATRAGTREAGMSSKEYIITSVLTPDAYIVEGYDNLMPSGFGTKLSGVEFDTLIAYLETLE